MIKRLNYTGRKRIASRYIRIRVEGRDPLKFHAQFSPEELQLPADAQVWLDVNSAGSTSSRRFSMGTIGELRSPLQEELDGYDADTVLFDMRVVDATEALGRILGVARGLKPKKPGEQDGEVEQIPLLPVSYADLGMDIWHISFDDGPCLVLNNQIEGIRDIALGDRTFYSLVYPQAVRRVLTQIILVDEQREVLEGEDFTWWSRWLEWGKLWHPDELSAASLPEEKSEHMSWIDEVAANFAKERRVRDLYTMEREGTESGR